MELEGEVSDEVTEIVMETCMSIQWALLLVSLRSA